MPTMLLRAALAAAAALTLAAAPAHAKLPTTKTTTIVPNVSIGGVKLDMTKAQALKQWGPTKCEVQPHTDYADCIWAGRGEISTREEARIQLYKGKVIQVGIRSAVEPRRWAYKRGPLSAWKTTKGGIGLGSKKQAVRRAYPEATENRGEAVQGYDIFKGTKPRLKITTFGSFGFGTTPTLLREIVLRWDVCGYDNCRAQAAARTAPRPAVRLRAPRSPARGSRRPRGSSAR